MYCLFRKRPNFDGNGVRTFDRFNITRQINIQRCDAQVTQFGP